MIGLRGSHDQSLPRRLAAGSRVFVCDNLSFSGEAVIQTKQTLRIADRLPGLMPVRRCAVLNAVKTLPGMFEVQDARFTAYKETTMKPRWGDAAIVELVRRSVINPSHVGQVMKAWDEPSYEEHAEAGFTLWRLHNAVTAALKSPTDEEGRPTRPMVLPTWQRTTGMTTFFDEVAGFDVAKAL